MNTEKISESATPYSHDWYIELTQSKREEVLKYLSELTMLCQDFSKLLPQVDEQPSKMVAMYHREMIDTLAAIAMLYEKNLRVQALSLCRALIENYYTTLWLLESKIIELPEHKNSPALQNFQASNDLQVFKDSPEQVSPETRAELLMYKSILDAEGVYSGKYYTNDNEIFIKTTDVDGQREKLKNYRLPIYEKLLRVFADQKALDVALGAIKSCPNPAVAKKISGNFRQDAIYKVLCGSTHSRDLSRRPLQQPSDEEQFDFFSVDSMLLLFAIFSVFNAIYVLYNGLHLSDIAINRRTSQLQEKLELLIFYINEY